jgi:hypothetical protein
MVTKTDYRLDSEGRRPSWQPGERVWVLPASMEATVIEQLLSYDYPETFWGDVHLQYDDGIQGISHSWQLARVIK